MVVQGRGNSKGSFWALLFSYIWEISYLTELVGVWAWVCTCGEREGGRERENRKMLAVLASGALNSPICHCHLQVICRLGHGIPPTLANGNLSQCSDIKRLHHGAFPGTKDAAFHPARVLRAMSRWVFLYRHQSKKTRRGDCTLRCADVNENSLETWKRRKCDMTKGTK